VHLDRRLVLAADVAVAPIRELVGAVGQPADPLAEQALGMVHGVLERVADHLLAELRHVAHQAALDQPAGLVLREALGHALVGHPDVHVDQVPDRLVGDLVLVQLERGHPQALGVALGRVRVERAVHGAADVGPVAQRDREREHLAAGEDRADDLHVVLVRAAGVGVVVDEDVAGPELGDLLDQVLDRRLERPHVRRLVALAVGHEPAVRGEDRDRVVVPLGDRRRIGDALDQRARLVADRLERVAQDLERDRVGAQLGRGGGGGGLHGHVPRTSMSRFR
jgi:hypothetical protein